MFDRLKDRICQMLEDLEMKLTNNPSMSDLEKIQLLTGILKNLSCMEEAGYSQYSGQYMPGNSYARSRHYVRGHYSRAMDDDRTDYERR